MTLFEASVHLKPKKRFLFYLIILHKFFHGSQQTHLAGVAAAAAATAGSWV